MPTFFINYDSECESINVIEGCFFYFKNIKWILIFFVYFQKDAVRFIWVEVKICALNAKWTTLWIIILKNVKN